MISTSPMLLQNLVPCLALISSAHALNVLPGVRVRTITEEVRLHDGGELRRGAHALKHLLAVVPSHATLGNAAAHLHGAVQIVRRGAGD